MKNLILAFITTLSIFGVANGQSLQSHSDSSLVSIDLQKCYTLDPNFEFERVNKPKGVRRYSKRVRFLIASGKIQVGFTKRQTICSWGEPDNTLSFRDYRDQNMSRKERNRMKKFDFWFYDDQILIFKSDKLICVI